MSLPETILPPLARALAAKGYETLTPVQSAIIEDETAGRDLLVSAQTGSGKTVAFGMAIAPTLLGDAERFTEIGAPLALVIAPTRELALQVQRELDWLYAEAGARTASCPPPGASASSCRSGQSRRVQSRQAGPTGTSAVTSERSRPAP